MFEEWNLKWWNNIIILRKKSAKEILEFDRNIWTISKDVKPRWKYH